MLISENERGEEISLRTAICTRFGKLIGNRVTFPIKVLHGGGKTMSFHTTLNFKGGQGFPQHQLTRTMKLA